MAKKLKIFFILIWTVCGFALARPLWAGDDFQYWSAYEISKSFGPNWEIFFLPEFRVRDNASELFYHEYRQGVRWKPSRHLQAGLNYLLVRNEPPHGQPLWEHAGELDITPKASWKRLDFSLRGRAALRQIQGSSSQQEWEFRMMPQVAYRAEIFGRKFIPYAANDLFYNAARETWSQNRVFLGVSVPLPGWRSLTAAVNLYYMLQHQKNARGDWNSNHIFGTKLSLRF